MFSRELSHPSGLSNKRFRSRLASLPRSNLIRSRKHLSAAVETLTKEQFDALVYEVFKLLLRDSARKSNLSSDDIGWYEEVLALLEEFESSQARERAQKLFAHVEKIQHDRAAQEQLKLQQEIERKKKLEEEERLARIRVETEKRKRGWLEKIQLELKNDFQNVDAYYRDNCVNELSIDEFNGAKIEFVSNWVAKHLPADDLGHPFTLDSEQALAIAAVDGNVLVGARAGSGKTRTITCRTVFLIKHCRISPNEILLLAFNRKAAAEIRKRLLIYLCPEASKQLELEKKKGRKHKDKIASESQAVADVAERLGVDLPHVMTFHALAYAIVHPGKILFDDPLEESQELSREIQTVIDEHTRNPKYKPLIRDVMMAHFREAWDRIINNCYDKSKAELLYYRRAIPNESIAGEYVKSYGEKLIADFLFEHNISYHYEKNHWWNNLNYRPDFTIPVPAGGGVIIEYFGMKGDPDYDEMSDQKRIYWRNKPGWKLIELFPHDIKGNSPEEFTDLLKQSLQKKWHKLYKTFR
ncbi:MAG: hypothetical protein COZ00_10710 [Zetaproteobacteria bacterium CG_4_10_14_0_8_um_filter_49_80]|nr:MAG: hypothetical protein COZ00_10710 [Zetaproteobacteria bacterium CG_4_10_14_0_8_um_filter_49_80]